MKKCRLCESPIVERFWVIDKNHTVYRCSNCELIQLLVSPIDELDSTAAKNSIYQDTARGTSEEDMKINRDIGLSGPLSRCAHLLQQDSIRINKTIKKLIGDFFNPQDKIKFIDIGSGYGQNSFALKKDNPDLDVHLLEISKERMDSGIEVFAPDESEFTFHHSLLDDSFSENNPEEFDIALAFHVLEHVYDIKGFIKNILKVTKRGGYAILEVPNEDDDLQFLSENYKRIIHFPAHVSYFTKKTLSRLLRESKVYDKIDVTFVPVQRYGFFNYADWVRHDKKEMVLSDDYVPRKNLSWIEKLWLDTKKKNLTTDSIMMVIKKRD